MIRTVVDFTPVWAGYSSTALSHNTDVARRGIRGEVEIGAGQYEVEEEQGMFQNIFYKGESCRGNYGVFHHQRSSGPSLDESEVKIGWRGLVFQ